MDLEKVQPRILPGFMELLPQEQLVFNRILDIIRYNYELFGFTPMDTPVMELSKVLLAKAGGETEKQIYRFQKGDNDLSLRFDLTVPLARYVAMHYNDLVFPFKRYQIAKVYRGERPQRGRFREFYQCDIDVIDQDNLSIDVDGEMPAVISCIFRDLGITKFTIRISNRKLLIGYLQFLGISEKSQDVLRIIDKIDKIGQKVVIDELGNLGLSEDKISSIIDLISVKVKNFDLINYLRDLRIDNQMFIDGIRELESVLNTLKRNFFIDDDRYCTDLTIVRGLDYYTGTIYETILDDYPEIGSICSGGRYDNLTGFYTNKKFQGVGISIGVTRLFDQLLSRNLINIKDKTTLDALVLYLNDDDKEDSLKFLNFLRSHNVRSDIYISNTKLKNKLNYANKINVPFVVILGENERKHHSVMLRNMKTGEQGEVNYEECTRMLGNIEKDKLINI